MTQRERYDNTFIETFSIEKKDLGDHLEYESILEWDSIGHMAIIGMLEDTFDIVMDMSDIIDFSSYSKGIELLVEKYNLDL
jgi:acyl carrier protein